MVRVNADGVTFYQAGQLSPSDARPPTPDTQWEIGSITKVFTGILLARSEAERKVSRDDPAAKFLLPENDKDREVLAKITLLTLTTHTSDLPRLPANLMVDLLGDDPYSDYDQADLVKALRAHGRRAKTPQPVEYSNFGVGVLGEALGKAWGGSYQEALAREVLAPLGMKRTTLALAGSDQPEGIAPPLDGKKIGAHWTFQSMAPAGALLSSTRELALFLQACMGLRETPLKEVLAESMKPLRPTEDFPGSIGMGWFMTEGDDPILWHNGATGGFQSFLGFSNKRKEGLVILSNSGVGPDQLGFKLLAEGD